MAREDSDSIDADMDDDDDNIANTYLTFGVGGEEFALPVAHVTEIVRLQKIFAVPDVATHIRGVINLRGKVIPLLDVRAKFGIEQIAYTDRTVIVVIEVEGAPTGLVVDSVFDITEVPPGQIEPVAAGVQSHASPIVSGVINRGERVSFLVAVSSLVSNSPVVEALPRASQIKTHSERMS